MERLYSAQQVAEYCQVNVETVWRWFRNGKLKYCIVGRKKMVKESDLIKFTECEDNGGK